MGDAAGDVEVFVVAQFVQAGVEIGVGGHVALESRAVRVAGEDQVRAAADEIAASPRPFPRRSNGLRNNSFIVTMLRRNAGRSSRFLRDYVRVSINSLGEDVSLCSNGLGPRMIGRCRPTLTNRPMAAQLTIRLDPP